MPLRLSLLFVVAGLAWASMAVAQTATITRAVNVRAAPDPHFPPVTALLGGTRVEVVGCVENWRWCDVTAGRDRGWVHSGYLAVQSGGKAITILRGGPNLGLPTVEFAIGPYWNANYQGRPWLANMPYWSSRWARRPPQTAWRAPSN